MLVYITNRKLPNTPVASNTHVNKARIAVKDIKQTLNSAKPGGKKRIVFGLASSNYKNINFYPRGNESDLFDSIHSDEYKKPWLVFLHGYHQDPEETVKKAKLLHEIHGVNVVLFSWPSHPVPIKSFDTDNILQLLKTFVLNTVLNAGRPDLLGFFLGEVKKFIADYKNNYEPARRNAEKSTADFYAAMQLVDQHLLPRIKPEKLSLLVHSMGNYLLQKTLYDKNGLPIKFWNIISHQADVKSSNHASWLTGLFGYSANKIYVTVNVLDFVLAASYILHRISKRKDCERLGHSVQIKPEGVHQGYIQKTVSYLDFTDGYGVEVKHELFTCEGTDINVEPIIAEASQIDKNIVDLLGRIFRGEGDRLPVKKGRSSKSGFSMMPTLPRVYKPTWIIEDESLCDEGPDVDCFLRSLDEFNDPFKKEPEYIPELDDD
jgi:hypothetical protein